MSKGKRTSKNGFALRLSEDDMRLYIDYKPEKGKKKLNLRDVRALVKVLGITEPYDEDLIEQVLKSDRVVSDMLIAEGKPPRKGEDAQIVYEVQLEPNLKPVKTEDGGVDYHDLGGIIQARQGALLAQKLPGSKGLPGKTLTGEAVYYEPKDVNLPAGDNTIVTDDGLTLLASESGMVKYRNGLIHVLVNFATRGNVDYSTGDIEFCGSVTINGDVRPGFKVEAGGDIEIKGSVECAEIISRGGSVTVHGGILGKGRARIIAAGSVKAGFIQDSKITSGGDVKAGRYILKSEISAEGCIRVVESEGTIRGGKVSSKKQIIVKTAGSSNRIHTELQVGRRLDGRTLDTLMELDAQKEELECRLETNRKRIAFFYLLEERIDVLTSEKTVERDNLIRADEEIEAEIKRLEDRKLEIVTKSLHLSKSKEIEIISKVFPGVVVSIDNQEYIIDREMVNSRFRIDGGKLRVEYGAEA